MIHIHIGCHKTGSSSVQHFLAGNVDLLAAHGVSYPAIGRKGAAHFNLSNQFNKPPMFVAERGSWADLVHHARSAPDRDIVISSEGFEGLEPADVATVAAWLRGLRVQVLMYVRDWTEVLPSMFAQQVKSGLYVDHFGRFFQSAIRRLERREIGYTSRAARWAAALGDDALRIRAIDPRSLAGADLVTDFLSGIGHQPAPMLAAAAPDSLARRNASPGWKTVELLRRWHVLSGARRAAEDDGRYDTAVVRQAHRIRRFGLDIAAELGLDGERGQYLSRAQWQRARAHYALEAAELNRRFGCALPAPVTTEPPRRPFAPALDHVPAGERAIFDERMTAAGAIVPDRAVRSARSSVPLPPAPAP